MLNQSSPHPSTPVDTTTPEGPAPRQSSPQASISVRSSPDPGQVDDTGDGGTEGDSEKVASTHLIPCTEAEQQEQGTHSKINPTLYRKQLKEAETMY